MASRKKIEITEAQLQAIIELKIWPSGQYEPEWRKWTNQMDETDWPMMRWIPIPDYKNYTPKDASASSAVDTVAEAQAENKPYRLERPNDEGIVGTEIG